MKTTTVVLLAVCAVSAWGTDLNPGAGKAQATGIAGINPWEISLKDLWARGDSCPDITWVWADYDGHYWNYHDPNDPYQLYLYMVFKFAEPQGYDEGDLKWRIWGTSGLETKIWRWKPSTQTWEFIDSISGVYPDTQTYSSIPASWFNVDGELFIMATCAEDANDHNIVADRIDIQW